MRVAVVSRQHLHRRVCQIVRPSLYRIHLYDRLHCLPIKRFFSFTRVQKAVEAPTALPLPVSQKQTIYALSTPPGKAGVAVIRISGPEALDVWSSVVVPRASKGRTGWDKDSQTPVPWKLERCHIVHPASGETLDDGLAVFFKGPRSFTTEDVVELHIHSGPALIASVLSALAGLPHCRPAEPGEFTRRAFDGGRLDLTQVEGLNDLIHAETESQRRQALQVAEGRVRQYFEELRRDIIRCLAQVEALIDFGDTDDVDEDAFEQAIRLAAQLRQKIRQHLEDRRGEIIRSGIRLAIFGPPNAGKSSLLNFLAQREAAIVTPIPGTTRDVLEVSLDLDGLLVTISDTAGLRETEDIIEAIGVERARKAVASADIPLCVVPLNSLQHESDGYLLPEDLRAIVEENPNTFFIFNKSDLTGPAEVSRLLEQLQQKFRHDRFWLTSLTSGEGTKELLKGLAEQLKSIFELGNFSKASTPYITHSRHRAHLESAEQFLSVFLNTAPEDVVLGAEELRYAAQAIGRISGLIDVEDVLDSVFKDFCIGK